MKLWYNIFMQTFLISDNPIETARILDVKRLMKQRVEAIQILRVNIGLSKSNGWKNHPAVRMWKNYSSYLLHIYLRAMLNEAASRSYKNTKCNEHYSELSKLILDPIEKPSWFSEELFTSHKSNLLRKDFSYYSKFFNVSIDISYVWPV